MKTPLSQLPFERRLLWGLLAVFIVLRIVVLWRYQADLSADPDAYLGLARSLAEGHGFSAPGTDQPTAYRPPLYPLLLTPFSGPHQLWQRGLLQLVLSILTFFAIWRTGRNLGLPNWSRLAACAIFTVDPLALRYIAFPMTETLCACLVSLLMVVLTEPKAGRSWDFLSGLTFGLCVLSRPTFWVFGILYAPIWWWIRIRSTGPATDKSNHHGKQSSKILWKSGLAAVAGVAVCVLPWVLRNWSQMGTPIVMTTHGGYTLLLGNNEAFYREVVNQPWGTIWDGSHGPGQSVWLQGVQQELREENISGEVATDRWLSRRAWQTIFRNPGTFSKACLLKFCWFWNIIPIGPEARAMPAIMLWGIGSFYAVFWLMSLLGLARVLWRLWRDFEVARGWLVPVLLVISLSGVHLIYWSDTRMRAPITPALALIAAGAFSRNGSRNEHD